MNPILLRGRQQSIPACALIVEADGLQLAWIILGSERTRIEFNVYVSKSSRSIASLIQFLKNVAAWNGSRIEVEERGEWIDHIDIIPALPVIDSEVLTRRLQNAIVQAIQDQILKVRKSER